jgi:hypothetical protein
MAVRSLCQLGTLLYMCMYIFPIRVRCVRLLDGQSVVLATGLFLCRFLNFHVITAGIITQLINQEQIRDVSW